MVTLARRDFLALAGFASVLGWPTGSSAQPTPPGGGLVPLNRFSRMVQEWYVRQVRAALAQGDAVRAGLKTRADAEAYIRDVKKRIMECFGRFPEKTPLNPRITGKLERDAYTVEKVIFESRPGFLVTANLYLPKGKKLPAPGVVGSCGHSTDGKAADAYQGFAQALVRMGYVCLIFDPIGQGERLQYTHVNKLQRPAVGVGEHLYAGNQQFLVGEFFGSWRAWDGIRALDYLLSRPEVDPHHVGITGNSGGGTMTTWLCGVEDRWTMAAPACFVTSFRRNMENELPQDTEQCPPRALALGLDHLDFLAAMAPKPVIILAKEKDYFDVRGSQEAYEKLKRIYGLLGAEENVGLFVGPTPHGYSQENREAMYRWFNRVTKISDAQAEPPLTLEKKEDLWCTPNGQVAELKSRTVFSFTKEKAEKIEQILGRLSRPSPKNGLRSLLKIPPQIPVPEYRILRTGPRKYPRPYSTVYAVETEADIFTLVTRLSETPHVSRPTREPTRAVLYVSHQSADVELREEPLVKELLQAEPGSTFYACDVRGIGESRPDTCGTNSFTSPYGSDYFYAIYGLMLDRPYPGQKTLDVLGVIAWLKDIGHREIHLAAKGWGTIPATFAAVLSDDVTQVTLKNALTSYADVAKSELYGWPLSCFVPNALGTDLPDCYALLKQKKLSLVDPVGPEGVK